MSDTITMPSIPIELDEAFKCAVASSWGDLAKHVEPRSVRVEYLRDPGGASDQVKVWAVGEEGTQDLVCDYSTWTSSARPSRVRFIGRYSSEKLSRMLDFVMKNQDQFTHRIDASPHGLVIIYPPERDARAEADTERRDGRDEFEVWRSEGGR